jgi:hypothetical protein
MEKAISAAALFIWMLMLAVFPSSGAKGQPDGSRKQADAGKDMVYVCACLNTKSCSCMTEAKTPGPCACGTQGGPPMKAVPHDSAWAQENRDALAK